MFLFYDWLFCMYVFYEKIDHFSTLIFGSVSATVSSFAGTVLDAGTFDLVLV